MAFDDLDEAETERASTAETTPEGTPDPGSDADPDPEPDADGAAEATSDARGSTGGRTSTAEASDDAHGDADSGATSRESTGSDGSSNGSTAEGAAESAARDAGDPAFGFEEAKQRPLYARQAAWDAFEDALAIEVETTLRRNDVRDAPKRELHDAALRVLADHADEVADRVLAERGVER